MAKGQATEANNEFTTDSFKKMSVSVKLKTVFGKFRNNLVIVFIVIFIIDLVAILNLRSIYSVYYEQNTQQGEIRITIQALAKYYLWAMNAYEDDDRQEQINGAYEKIADLILSARSTRVTCPLHTSTYQILTSLTTSSYP